MAWNQPGKKNEKPAGQPPASQGSSGKNSALPPELDNVLKKLNGIFGNSISPVKITGAVLLVLILVYGALGFHQTGPDEKSAVFRFGKMMALQDAGLHWNLPAVDAIRTLNMARLEQAVVTADVVTADENILGITMVVHYRISDAKNYLLNFSEPESALVHAAESALREVAVSATMAELVRDERAQLAENISRKLQAALASYAVGLVVSELNLTEVLPGTEVRSAFDAELRAREEAGRQQAKATTEATKTLATARKEAAGLLAEAAAYQNEMVSRARTEAARLEPLLTEYKKAPELVRDRLREAAMKEARK